MKDLITADELSQRLNLDPETIKLAVKVNAIPCYELAKRVIRFDYDEVRAVLEARLKEYGLAKGTGPPEKSRPGVAATAPDRGHCSRNAQYKVRRRRSRKKRPPLAEWLFAELASIQHALQSSYINALEQRAIRLIQKSTTKKLLAVAGGLM